MGRDKLIMFHRTVLSGRLHVCRLLQPSKLHFKDPLWKKDGKPTGVQYMAPEGTEGTVWDEDLQSKVMF